MGQQDCIFCGIAAGEIAAQRIHEDEDTVAFRDVDPKAPTHVLVIPRRHIPSVNALEREDAALVGKLFMAARQLAHEAQLEDAGYRLVMNCGPDAGQSVDHIHLHLLGGRRLGWPPG